MNNETKDKIYDLIELYKNRFVHSSNIKSDFLKILNDNNIIFEELKDKKLNVEIVFDYLTLHWNKKCALEGCHNITQRNTLWPRRNGPKVMYKKTCSKECNSKLASNRQKGTNNTSFKMSEEAKIEARKKQSITMKRKIFEGEFIPNITNSWAGSKVSLFINGKNIYYRSSWEAFFHLCNPHLDYEKIIVKYFKNKEEKNYIVDFVDFNKKTIYEIKPEKLKRGSIYDTKCNAALEWAKINGYVFTIIDNTWFLENVKKNKHLLGEQNDKNIIMKRLNQFDK